MSESTPTTAAIAAPEQTTPAVASPSLNGEQQQPNTTANTASSTTKPTTTTPPSKDTNTTSKPSIVEQVKRYIPGLGNKDEASKGNAPASKRKNKSGKKGTATDLASAKDPALATATLEKAPSKDELPSELLAPAGASTTRHRPAGLNGSAINTPTESEGDSKKFSAAAYVQKRLRTNNKKIQKLQTYEALTTPLNEDQKKSLAQKPVLEAIQRELGEISKAFESEEADEVKRADKQKKAEEQRIQQRVAAAVSDQKNDLALLLQFLHLYSLFNPNSNSQYSQNTVPPVVANATAQQHAAVAALFNNLANGPLVGSGDDAVSHIENLRSGSSKEVIEGVSFSDVKQMILDLTAGPAEMGHELPPSVDAPLPSIVTEGEATTPTAGLTFMQASEIEGQSQQQQREALSPGVIMHTVNTEIGSNAPTPGFGNTPSAEKTEAAANGNGWNAPPQLVAGSLPAAGSGWADEPVTGAVKNWADDVEESGPVDPNTVPPEVPAEVITGETNTSRLEKDADGFQRDTRREGRGRGGGRGGRGRGGNYAGGHASGNGEWRERPVRPDFEGGRGSGRGGRGGRGEGRGRGGRGRGEGHGRGRGGHQGDGLPTTASAGGAQV